MILGSTGAQLGSLRAQPASVPITAVARIINVFGSYQVVIDVVGTYRSPA